MQCNFGHVTLKKRNTSISELHRVEPQKALLGVISGALLEPLVHFCQLLAEKCPGFLKYVS